MIEQRSPEWFTQRAGKLTASRFKDLMATTRSGPSTSRANLISQLAAERFTGQCVEGYTNAAMQRGIALEEEARSAYEAETGTLVELAEFVTHPELPTVGASPDGYVGDVGLVEIKCPEAQAKHKDALKRGAHADEYRWQLQGQLWVTGRQWVDAVSYDPRFGELSVCIVRVPRDESAIDELRTACGLAELEILAELRELVSLRDQRATKRKAA